MPPDIIAIREAHDRDESARESERALMVRVRHGDEQAMGELIGRFGPSLSQLVGRLTGWSADSDDILQEVFLTAWRKAKSYRGAGSLEGWLRKLAVNRCRNHHRARAAFQRLVARTALRMKPADASSRHEELTNGELRAAIARLSPSDRAVLVLFYLEELSGEQVAEALGVRVDAVHVRLHRARQRLRNILNHYEENDG